MTVIPCSVKQYRLENYLTLNKNKTKLQFFLADEAMMLFLTRVTDTVIITIEAKFSVKPSSGTLTDLYWYRLPIILELILGSSKLLLLPYFVYFLLLSREQPQKYTIRLSTGVRIPLPRD